MLIGEANTLLEWINFRSPVPRQAAAGRQSCRGRQVLPGVYSVLTITGRSCASAKGLAMRIYGPNGTTVGTAPASVRRSGSSAFALPDTAATSETRSASAPRAAGNIDALLALQGIEDPVERRKRSVARGRGALDVLDDLKIGLLSGNFDSSTVNRLRDAAANLKSSSGDPGLDAVLSEIELRVEVELAKAGQY